MNILNKERELQEISDIESIQSIAGYISSIDSNCEFHEVIAVYFLNSSIKCGLSDCKTPHNRGYIFSTKNGNVSNIGHVCGRKVFKLDFQTSVNKFKADLEEKKHRDFLLNFDIPSTDTAINELLNKDHGAKWLQRLITNITSPAKTPNAIIRKLKDAGKTNNPQITIEREASAQEKETDKAANRAIRQIISQQLCILKGISILSETNNLQTLLIIQGSEVIQMLKSSNVLSLPRKELKALWTKAKNIEMSIKTATFLINEGNIFFSQENLAPLSQLIELPEERTSFAQLISQLPQ